ncbi:ATP-binding protein [candidate division KSB1 bacterium]|nr:ATP-binding protein [candidate division KSB1 bacterium]MBL7094983.1 ATP-binding protein [candidate division KSB1 bacterium]
MSRINFPKIYNPANQSAEELINNFVVRTKIFRDIYDDIKNSEMEYPEQHYIIQGIRGQGKTTLLLRIAYEIKNDNELNQRIIPIIFNEEQYHISRLFKLWETTAEYLEESSDIKGLFKKMQEFENDDDYEHRCFQLLENTLKKHKRKVILFIDNIDEMLNKFSKREHQRLREVFVESAELRVIGASSVSLEFHYDYGKPFYQFFRMPQLKGLTTDETKILLLKLGAHYKIDRVRDIVESQPGRIEALRRITGGVIRTIVLLFEIFVDDENGNAFFDLEKILDNVTPMYKHRMDKLSAQQQEIVDFVALRWDAVSTKEIAKKTRLESKAVSAQLKQLEKFNIIEKQRTNTKNHLYRIYERFFNIWYLMRLGRKWDVKRVRFLVEFLETWCDENELENRAKIHLGAIKRGGIYQKHAFIMTEALLRTPLKKDLQNQLIAETKMYLNKSRSELCEDLSLPDFELEQAADNACNLGDYDIDNRKIDQYKVKDEADFNKLDLLSLSIILLLNNQIDIACQVAQEYLIKSESYAKFSENISLFFQVLIAKKQYHLTLKIFNENPNKLKDRFKPVYYALMSFMQKEYPNEYKKMGTELSQTVEEIIKRINKLEKDME